jgi:hypothetical protein
MICEGMERINLAQDRDKWQGVTNIVIKCLFSQNAGGIVSFLFLSFLHSVC